MEGYPDFPWTSGIPLLYPWANRLAEFGYDGVALDPDSPDLYVMNGLPLHGLRSAVTGWEVVETEMRMADDVAPAKRPYSPVERAALCVPDEHELDFDSTSSQQSMGVDQERCVLARIVQAADKRYPPLGYVRRAGDELSDVHGHRYQRNFSCASQATDAGRRMSADCRKTAAREDRGFEIWEIAGGYQIRTRPELAPWVAQLQGLRPVRLSAASLETLALIAYRQPMTRAEIEHVRGVDVGTAHQAAAQFVARRRFDSTDHASRHRAGHYVFRAGRGVAAPTHRQ